MRPAFFFSAFSIFGFSLFCWVAVLLTRSDLFSSLAIFDTLPLSKPKLLLKFLWVWCMVPVLEIGRSEL